GGVQWAQVVPPDPVDVRAGVKQRVDQLDAIVAAQRRLDVSADEARMRSVCLRRRALPAGALAVLAPRPAAGPALAFLQLLLGPANAALSGHLLLGIRDPADELVAGQRRDVLPRIECRGVGDQR